MKKNILKISVLLAFTIVVLTNCKQDIEMWLTVSEIDMGNTDNYKISGIAYNAETNEPIAGAVIDFMYPQGSSTQYNQIVTDKNGHYLITGLKSWYTHMEEDEENTDPWNNYVWDYNIVFGHKHENYISDQAEDGDYIDNQNDYMVSAYNPLLYIDLENQTDVNHITQNLYVPKINFDISINAKLIWDDGLPVQLNQIQFIRVNPYYSSPKDGRAGHYNPDEFEYDETTGNLTLSNHFADGSYTDVTVYLYADNKDITNTFSIPGNYLDEAINLDTLKQDKQRSVYINITGANDFEGLYLYYALCKYESVFQHIYQNNNGQISMGKYSENRFTNEGFEYFEPGEDYYLKAYLDSVLHPHSWPWDDANFAPLFETDYIPFEVSYDVFDVSYFIDLIEFKENK